MSKLYKRVANVTVTNKLGIGRDFAGLRVHFSVTKTTESASNKGVVKIWNLSKTSRTFLESKELVVRLSVGYEGMVEQLFVGDVGGADGLGKTMSVRESPDWVTTIEAGDGETALATKHVDKSFKAGTPISAVIADAVSALGVAIGPQSVVGTEITLGGMSVSGKVKDVIDRLAARFGFEWSVQDNAIQITKQGMVTPETAVVVSPTTGLISNVIKTENGVQFKSLIIPQLRPGRACQITGSGDTNGFFKVRKAVFEGDTHDGDWTVTVEAEPIG